ncbi:MAG: type II toxin-antitoxin system HicA family toxin [Methanomicrobiales archaeon]|nr:type II toxin-antitoxin system HicA family toxin [Methanomicrobiales archaeon]
MPDLENVDRYPHILTVKELEQRLKNNHYLNSNVVNESVAYNRGLILKVREIIKMIDDDGWYLVVMKSSHRQYKHPEKPGRITIAGHPGDDPAPGNTS